MRTRGLAVTPVGRSLKLAKAKDDIPQMQERAVMRWSHRNIPAGAYSGQADRPLTGPSSPLGMQVAA